jgi:hypothetical protein
MGNDTNIPDEVMERLASHVYNAANIARSCQTVNLYSRRHADLFQALFLAESLFESIPTE